jgi:hypothetical protein
VNSLPQSISDNQRQFEAGLSKLKFELQKNLNEIDPLDSKKLESLIGLFSQRLVIFQHEFLEFLAKQKGSVSSSVQNFAFSNPKTDKIAEMAGAIIGGGAASGILVFIPVVTTTGWLWTTTSTISLAAYIAATVGCPIWAVIAALTVGTGIGGGYLAKWFRDDKRREQVKAATVEWFDKEVVTKLREWSAERIGEIF